ncbi:hypothetical protein HDE78_000056 [Rhodanobacter sp. K2T2]|nr:hypothetical protein [Rhodanobacter sp. K2T2]
MSDDKSKAGSADRQCVNVNETYELRDWAKKWGVGTASLRRCRISRRHGG